MFGKNSTYETMYSWDWFFKQRTQKNFYTKAKELDILFFDKPLTKDNFPTYVGECSGFNDDFKPAFVESPEDHTQFYHFKEVTEITKENSETKEEEIFYDIKYGPKVSNRHSTP